tara:strand:+ start:4167 stop:5147 length:981 start_codon:yes stop_codon:yes gene_type:complete
MYFKFYIYLVNIFSTFCFKQPIPFADSSLSKRKIHKVPVLDNENVAVWWNKKSKEWNAVHDVCPHRQASLSDGVVNAKTTCIKCRYHGIEFNKHGKCIMIPSSTFNPSIFSVKNYYIKEKYNLLWIDDEKDSDIVIDILEKPHSKLPWFITSVKLPHRLLLENSIDSAHVSNVHSDMIPGVNRYKPFPVLTKARTNWFNETGFSVSLTNYLNFSTETVYISPYYTYINFPKTNIFAITIPINATSSRFISNLIIEKSNVIIKRVIALFSPLLRKTSPKIFEQDVFMINSQLKNSVNKKTYKNSGVADTPIILYNKWLDEYTQQTLF